MNGTRKWDTSKQHTLRYIAGPEDEDVKLRTILRQRLQVSRRLMTKLKFIEGGITVNGARLYMDAKLKPGDVVELRLPVETSETIEPQPMELDILYEDDYLLAVNKPAGIIVHPTLGHDRDTLANGVMYYWQQRGESYRFRPVHRLDEETSGVVVIAKNAYVHERISQQLQEHTVQKIYIAYVHGILERSSDVISAPIDRDPENPHIRIVTESGYPAVTAYEVLRTFAHASQVRLSLKTGRTHQIRVHMRWLGHPLIGDRMYALPEYDDEPYRALLPGQALHAQKIVLRHPIHDEDIQIEAPLPAELLRLQSMLEQGADSGR
ncbi:RNA pseudouridine synthase [Insulibacter thermoxylanivorax]|uniref:Pseudouridine synthase n=1 Tax=Insulibacter thermoxylanivorax TaxID=2749268 RepID=A0A916QD82_9BACL|nr:RluA family pseudouridine synthase [Insulibacter thermoxylanivorax]GFR38582.1 RNA pseudouridine synthase [Insulibacter thermoxylanivorax]